MKNILWFIPVLVTLVLWEFVSRDGFVNPTLFPPPSQVANAFSGMVTSTLFPDLQASAWRLLLGLCVGSTIGVTCGLLTGRIQSIAAMLSPIIHILRPLPPVAIIPLVIVWFGIDDGAKIFSIAFAVFFPIWVNTHMGVQRILRVFLWSAALLTDSSFKILREVVFPAALPFIIAGIRNGIAVAFIMVFVSELAGASSGLGYRIAVMQFAYRTDEMMAALVVLGALGATADKLFVFSTRKLYPWLRFSSA